MKNVIAALLLTLPAGLAFAQATPAPAPAATAKPLASRDEYRTCLRLGDEAVARRAKLQGQKADYDARTRQLQADMKMHLELKDTIKPGSKLADAYNADTEKLNARNFLLNAEADQFDKDILEHNRVSAEASKRCTGLTVSQEDMQAVNAERAAGKK
jgi:hypothetical protein